MAAYQRLIVRWAVRCVAAGVLAIAWPALAARDRAPASPPGLALDVQRPDVQSFVTEVCERREWSERWVNQQLAQARTLPTVQRLIMPAPVATAKNWAVYRARFVEPLHIAAGSRFWADNEAALRTAEQRFGVPPEIVVGIVGVETFYGRITGPFRVLDALATLAFDFPTGRSDRSPFFRAELEELLALAHAGQVDLPTLRGSFAGAIGWPQFMPGSLTRHAADGDGDGRIDLVNSGADIVHSVARFLSRHGWQRGMPTHFEATPPADGEALATLRGPDILPTFSAEQMTELGVMLSPQALAHDGALAWVELQNGGAAPSTFVGTDNFYAVTRYNWSAYYALAVIELGQAVARTRVAAAAR